MFSADTTGAVLGILGNITSMALFLSPMPTFYQIWRKGSVEEFSPAPYLAALLNCMLWVVYGLPLVHPHSILVLTVNGLGVLIELLYVLLFLIYSDGKKNKMKVFIILLIEVASVGLVAALVLTLAHTCVGRSLIIGSLCVVFSVLMYGAPLSAMNMVIRTKSVEYMPFMLSLTSFVNGLCWTAFAAIRFDLFLMIPNALGAMSGLIQLVLHAAFCKSTERQLEARKAKGMTTLTETLVVVATQHTKKYNAPSD